MANDAHNVVREYIVASAKKAGVYCICIYTHAHTYT